MKSKLLSILLLPLVLSCSIHSGSISTTEVDSETLFKDTAYGISEAKYFLSFGGLSQNTMINNAKKQLYLNRPLQTGESYANFAVDIKHTSYILFSKQTVTVSADIIEETPNSPENRFSETFRQKLNNLEYADLFKIGDKVIDTDFEPCTITGFIGNDHVSVLYPSGKKKKKNLTQLFNTNESFRNVTIGSTYSSTNYKGTVIAVGIHKLVIVDDYNVNKIVFYK